MTDMDDAYKKAATGGLSAMWAEEDAKAKRLTTAVTAAEVKEILGNSDIGTGESFWIGDGADLVEALGDAGWSIFRYAAEYYWVMRKMGWPDHEYEYISYTEGDVDYSDNPACAS